MSLAELLTHYGYLAVFVGSVLEGETLLVLAGFAAHQGYLSLHWVIVLALCGGTLGDQIYFFLGRRFGDTFLRRLPRLSGPAQRVHRLLLRYDAGLIVAVRFMYGLRIVGPIVIGTTDVSAWRFVVFNVIGATIWAVTITALGFLFGHALQLLLADVRRYEEVVLLFIVGVAAVVGLLHWRLQRKERQA